MAIYRLCLLSALLIGAESKAFLSAAPEGAKTDADPLLAITPDGDVPQNDENYVDNKVQSEMDADMAAEMAEHPEVLNDPSIRKGIMPDEAAALAEKEAQQGTSDDEAPATAIPEHKEDEDIPQQSEQAIGYRTREGSDDGGEDFGLLPDGESFAQIDGDEEEQQVEDDEAQDAEDEKVVADDDLDKADASSLAQLPKDWMQRKDLIYGAYEVPAVKDSAEDGQDADDDVPEETAADDADDVVTGESGEVEAQAFIQISADQMGPDGAENVPKVTDVDGNGPPLAEPPTPVGLYMPFRASLPNYR